MRVQKKLIVIAGALSGLLLIGCGEQEINLEDYLTVTYSGANGYALPRWNLIILHLVMQ